MLLEETIGWCNFWHGESFPAWGTLNVFLSLPSDARIHGQIHLLKPQKEIEIAEVLQRGGLAETGLCTAGAGLSHLAWA